MSCFFRSYHIAGTAGVYYDREPYDNIDVSHVTRFIALASVGNKEKQVQLFFYFFMIHCRYFITFALE